MWGNRLPVRCALKSPHPFCKSIRAQSKHLSSKPFYHLISASFSPHECLEKALNAPFLGWLNTEVGYRRSCLDPHRLISQETAQTSAPLNRLTDLGRSLFRAIQHSKIQHIARCCSPSRPHQLKQCAGKSVFSVSAPWPFFKKQRMNSKDFKGPAFRIWIIHFQSKLTKVQEILCHCSSIVIWQVLVNHWKER